MPTPAPPPVVVVVAVCESNVPKGQKQINKITLHSTIGAMQRMMTATTTLVLTATVSETSKSSAASCEPKLQDASHTDDYLSTTSYLLNFIAIAGHN